MKSSRANFEMPYLYAELKRGPTLFDEALKVVLSVLKYLSIQ